MSVNIGHLGTVSLTLHKDNIGDWINSMASGNGGYSYSAGEIFLQVQMSETGEASLAQTLVAWVQRSDALRQLPRLQKLTIDYGDPLHALDAFQAQSHTIQIAEAIVNDIDASHVRDLGDPHYSSYSRAILVTNRRFPSLYSSVTSTARVYKGTLQATAPVTTIIEHHLDQAWVHDSLEQTYRSALSANLQDWLESTKALMLLGSLPAVQPTTKVFLRLGRADDIDVMSFRSAVGNLCHTTAYRFTHVTATAPV